MDELQFINGGYFYNDHIRLTGYPKEDHRIPRLQRIIGYVQALCDQERDEVSLVLNKVGGLKDHKGTLFVYWTEMPNEYEKSLFNKAWLSRIGDGSVIEHEIFKHI